MTGGLTVLVLESCTLKLVEIVCASCPVGLWATSGGGKIISGCLFLWFEPCVVVTPTAVTNFSGPERRTRRRQLLEADTAGVTAVSANILRGSTLRATLAAPYTKPGASTPWVAVGN